MTFESLLDYIVQTPHTNYIYDGWANGAMGTITDHSGRCIYRFFEAFYDENGKVRMLTNNDENAPIVAVGIVAYWLHYRKNPNRLATLWATDYKVYTKYFLGLYATD